MKVDTYLFGSIEVDAEKVIVFPKGLAGFEENTRFMLAHEVDRPQGNTFTLQSLDEPTLAFQIVDPGTLGFSYSLALTEDENAVLQSPAAEDVAVMQVLYRAAPEEGGAITPSLRAPLVINTRARLGLQKVMETVKSNIVLSNLASPV